MKHKTPSKRTRLRKRFMPEPGDPMIALHSAAPPNFQPPLDVSPATLASVKEGLKESAERKRIYRGSFAKNAPAERKIPAKRLKALDELAKQAQELKMGYEPYPSDEVRSRGEKLRKLAEKAFPTDGEIITWLLTPSAEFGGRKPIELLDTAKGAKKLEAALKSKDARRHRRKRVLLPEFKKLMSKKTVGSTQADLDAVRADR